MLLGLNLPEQPAFALILVGDPYLLSTLRLRSHRALYSRIAAHARIERLSRSEVETYLEHQLRHAWHGPSIQLTVLACPRSRAA